MMARVQLFARARDLAGADVLEIELADHSTVGELRLRIGSEFPRLRDILPRSALAVNEEYADDSVVIPDGADVALLPPVSGG